MKSSDNNRVDKFDLGPSFFVEIPSNASDSVSDSADVFDEDGSMIEAKPVPGYKNELYMPFGPDDELPYHLTSTIGSDEVMSQNLFFNVLTAYGSGIEYIDLKTKEPTRDEEIEDFMFHNSIQEFFLEQCTDMKHFFFCVAVIILDRAQEKICRVVHKDASFIRFEKADKHGRINHVYYANFKVPSQLSRDNVERVRLLDQRDPLGDLLALVGKAPGRDGLIKKRTTECKFAVVMRFPTPGQKYYPMPYYTAIFRGDWFDIKRLIGKGKKTKIRNHASVKYQVEIHKDYWNNIIFEEGIVDEEEKKRRIDQEKENIKKFVTGIENSGKVWITQYYVDPNGNEQRMVRINVIDKTKEGGDWSEDVQEAANMECYSSNVHPNLVGATPGKSQMNNSGSDKRELFTLKQSTEKAFHDMLLKVHNLIIRFNGWRDKVRPTVPMMMLTTLDKKTDAKKIQPDGTETDVNN